MASNVQIDPQTSSLRPEADVRGAAAFSQLKALWGQWLSERLPLFNYLEKIKKKSRRSTQESNVQAHVESDVERGLESSASAFGDTMLYLAYGSNLSAETFLGKRGIKPISQLNVVVPSLTLTFDLAGLPYSEPCFANTARRQPNGTGTSMTSSASSNEKTPLLLPASHTVDYHKNRWHKGLVGVVYELTHADYAHVIETEGGGASYHDILVECHPLTASSPDDPVPEYPSNPPILVHTLFAPAMPDDPNDNKRGRVTRPDPAYAQASARYLNLITDGAAEHSLPTEYRAYLEGLRPYTMTSQKQRLGQFIFLAIWMPVVGFIFGVQGLFSDENGRYPDWLVQLSSAVFAGIWASYDTFFKDMFGDGERTVKAEQEDGETSRPMNAVEGPRVQELTEKGDL